MISMSQWINNQLNVLNHYKRDKSKLEKMYIKMRLDGMLNSYIQLINWEIDRERIKNSIELDLDKKVR